MAKSPNQRDPAKHSKKDPAKPTRAKAARPDVPVLDDSLADLLNPAIGQGTAGLGSQTGLKPPPDNSWDRRADFANAQAGKVNIGFHASIFEFVSELAGMDVVLIVAAQEESKVVVAVYQRSPIEDV